MESKKAGKLNLIILDITLFSLLYFIVSVIPGFNIFNLQPLAPEGCDGIALVAALLFFAFTGYARINTFGEEVIIVKGHYFRRFCKRGTNGSIEALNFVVAAVGKIKIT